ncbi:MAG TPA: TetR/AcrR family transcriptional regulator [Desulfuromonadales bacterium]|nr:TetR/AcrR family transcriptional regulator [Desulfuromonadales bacterium]
MTDPAMGPKKYHHGDLRYALIQAGIEIVREQGAHNLTLRSVGTKAGVSRSALYRHFSCKDALLAAIAEKGFKILYETTKQSIDQFRDRPLEAFRESGRVYFRFAMTEREYYRVMFNEACALNPEKYPELHAAGMQTFNQLIETIETCQSSGDFRAGDAQQIGLQVWSAVHGLTMLQLDGQLRFLDITPEQIFPIGEGVSEMMVRGLSA